MKFVDIRGTQEVLSIEIILPELSPDIEYYYPDGIEKGILWWRKTYFLSTPFQYYQDPREILEKGNFVKDGKIWIPGKIITTLKTSKSTMTYQEVKEVDTFLENLISRCGVDLSSLICLETPETISLYEYKSSRLGKS